MKKKVLSIVLALCLAACLIPLMGAASGDVTCPECGSSEYLAALGKIKCKGTVLRAADLVGSTPHRRRNW